MKLSETAAYLKGLAEGMNIAEATPNDKLITKLLDLVAEMAGTIELLSGSLWAQGSVASQLSSRSFPELRLCYTRECSARSPEQMRVCLDTSPFSVASSKPSGDEGLN